MSTNNRLLFHFDAEMLFRKIDRGKGRQIRIPFAAARPADFADCVKCLCRHLVRKSPRIRRERRRMRDDRNEHTGADPRTARAPEAARAAGNRLAAAHHLRKCLVKLDFAARIFVRG